MAPLLFVSNKLCLPGNQSEKPRGVGQSPTFNFHLLLLVLLKGILL